MAAGGAGAGRALRVEAHMAREPAARRARRGCLQPAHKAAMWVESRRAVEQTGLWLFRFGDHFFQAS